MDPAREVQCSNSQQPSVKASLNCACNHNSVAVKPVTNKVDEWLQLQASRTVSRESLLDSSFAGPVVISVVIPAYNEEKRLAQPLMETLEYLRKRGERFELLVVNDGSTDGTAALVGRFQEFAPEIKLINVTPNRGKGYAVREGMLRAQGLILGFVDADGSTPILEIDKLLKALQEGADVAIGSRALSSQDTKVQTSIYRRLLGRLFNFVVNLLLVPEADTQCGFKWFRKEAGKYLFENLRENGYSLDFKLLHRSHRVGLIVAEIPVNWTNMAGSKVHPWRDGLKMLLNVVKSLWELRGVTSQDYQNWLRKQK